jgi:hypothetical protein
MTPEAQQPGSEAGHAPAGNHTAIPFENPATGVEFLQNCHRDVPEIPRFQMAAMVLSAGIHFFGASFFSVLVTFHIPWVRTPLSMRCATLDDYHWGGTS